MHPNFSPEESLRYSRHFALPEFGRAGQHALKNASVLIVGAGGLGSPLALYLAAAGVGTLGLADFDAVEESNLQRQVLFATHDLGQNKAVVAKQKIEALNPHIRVVAHTQKVTASNALSLLAQYDLVADGTDNFPTRYLLNDACFFLGIPLVYGAIYRFEGQVSVFNHLDAQGQRGPNYRDLFPEPPPPNLVPNCAEEGVLGVLPGIVGSLQANEVIKLLTGIGTPLSGRLHLFDALHVESRTMRFKANPQNPLYNGLTDLIDYDAFCGLSRPDSSPSAAIREISPAALQQKRQAGEPFILLDVREPHEYATQNLGGKLIPLSSLSQAADTLPRNETIVVHCRSGQRSAQAIALLQEKYGFQHLVNLKGGLLGWLREVGDTTLL